MEFQQHPAADPGFPLDLGGCTKPMGAPKIGPRGERASKILLCRFASGTFCSAHPYLLTNNYSLTSCPSSPPFVGKVVLNLKTTVLKIFDVIPTKANQRKVCAIVLLMIIFFFLIPSIDFEIARGQLVAVVGHVGSGKSSLIGSLLGESTKLSGRVVVNVRVLFVYYFCLLCLYFYRQQTTLPQLHVFTDV